MGNMDKSNGRVTFKDILWLILFIFIIAIPIYFAYTILFPRVEIFDQNQEQEETQEEEQEEEVYDGPYYKETYEIIQDQAAYIAVPTRIEKEDPPSIIVYSHGSNTTVTSNTEDDFMKDLQKYGEFFTQHNLVFAASNQHGANWGSDLAIQDTLNMIEWIKERYDTKEKTNMIGFSMGGLPTMNFVSKYPELINKVALLAPTTNSNEWDSQRVEKIKDIDIKIWHGTSDVNVGYSLSTTFVNRLATFNKEVVLVTLDGKTHWDLDTQYMDEILEFFLN